MLRNPFRAYCERSRLLRMNNQSLSFHLKYEKSRLVLTAFEFGGKTGVRAHDKKKELSEIDSSCVWRRERDLPR